MSEPILPLLQWPAGIHQASVPANDNALRLEALSRPCLGVANDATGSDADGDVWIVGDAPAGAFAGFDEHDIALYHVDQVTAVGGWHAWAPVPGLRIVVNDVRKVFNGSAWIDDPSITGGGGGGGATAYTIVTEASAFTADPGTHDGLTRLVLAGGDVTFDNAEPYTSGMTFNIRATAAIELIEDNVTLTPPAGGTLELDADMAVQVVFTGATTAVVIGQTVASS
jgi:hypothetical protein